MELRCPLCEHIHEEDGSCECGCESQVQVDKYCWSCGHVPHHEKPCKCGCEG